MQSDAVPRVSEAQLAQVLLDLTVSPPPSVPTSSLGVEGGGVDGPVGAETAVKVTDPEVINHLILVLGSEDRTRNSL